MLSFENDYSQGAHERILERLVETNRIAESGYGNDQFTAEAVQKIRQVIDCPEAAIHFLTGGTQTNQIVIDSLLASYEGVIAADTGHITVHEAGAIEYSGHKVLALPSDVGGKISAEAIEAYIANFYLDGNHTHMVYPGMVYLSYPTEYGFLYSKQELEAIRKVCDRYQIPLFIDGARLGYGLMSAKADLTIVDIAQLSDVFYIGGTKIGALCGEAVVFTKKNVPKNFTTIVKQHGALVAKGRLFGVQFATLFSDNLYFEISKHAVKMAQLLKETLLQFGLQLYVDSPTNQQFFVVSDEWLAELQRFVKVSFWEKADDTHTIIRFATSWATTKEQISELVEILEQLPKP